MKSVCVALALSGLAQASPSILGRLQADLLEVQPSINGLEQLPEPKSEEQRRRSTGVIEVCVRLKSIAGFRVPERIRGLTVKCYDEDGGANADDHMFSMTTGVDGCARGRYTDDGWNDFDYWSYADIYCEATSDWVSIVSTVTKVAYNHKASNGLKRTLTAYLDRTKYNFTGEQPNGCGDDGWAPVWTALSNMKNVCFQHDLCYSNCGETKRGCDDEFRDLMESRCRRLYSDSDAAYGFCNHIMAEQMHNLVKGPKGTAAWDAAQKKCSRN